MDPGRLQSRRTFARPDDNGATHWHEYAGEPRQEPRRALLQDADNVAFILVLDEKGRVLASSAPNIQALQNAQSGNPLGHNLADLLTVEASFVAGAIREAQLHGATSLTAPFGFFNVTTGGQVAHLLSFPGSEAPRIVLIALSGWMALRNSVSPGDSPSDTEPRGLLHEPHMSLIDAQSLCIWRSTSDGLVIDLASWGDFRITIGTLRKPGDWIGLVHPRDRETLTTHARKSREAGVTLPIHVRMLHSAGYYRLVVIRGIAVRGPSGEILEWIGTVSDVEDPEDADALRESETRLRLVVHASGMALWQVEIATGEVMWTREARELAGVDDETLIGPGFFDRLVHPDDRAAVSQRVRLLLRERGLRPYEITYRINRFDTGETRWIQECARLVFDQDGKPQRIVGAAKDVTALKQAEERLVHAVNHDLLTGLLNRRALQSVLTETLRTAQRRRGKVSLLVLDIDAFKTVNDSFGHAAGDTMLQLTAICLEAVIGDRGCVARLAGDAFAIVLDHDAGDANARVLADAVLSALACPFRYRGVTMSIRACVGIASFPEDAHEPLAILRHAEIALDHAKRAGRSLVRSFEPEMLQAIERRLTLVRDIGAALDCEQIVPFYQPKIDLRTGAIVGFEALARWNKSSTVSLTPQVFAAAFQDPYLAAAIDAAMLRRVMQDLSGWNNKGLRFGRVALNVSSSTLQTPGILDEFLKQIESAGVRPDQIQIEITESVLLDRDAQDAAALLRRFRNHGIRISLDDFGTGYASLVHLKHFPVDELKIDQSFVRNLERDAGDAAILSAVINLGRNLNIVTVAEGIETLGQADQLRKWGCHLGQGFLFASAMPAAIVPGLLHGAAPGPLVCHE